MKSLFRSINSFEVDYMGRDISAVQMNLDNEPHKVYYGLNPPLTLEERRNHSSVTKMIALLPVPAATIQW